MMDNQIKDVLVVGGGTSGWIMAARLAKQLDAKNDTSINITLVESPDIAGIGVGEGTFPTMRETLRSLGIPETEFIKRCNATFKQGIRFDHWEYSPKDKPGNHYYHLFNVPHTGNDLSLTDYWLLGMGDKSKSFANNLSNQASICDAGLAPKKITTPEYKGSANYAYHLDAKDFVEFLKEWSIEKLGVKHLLGNVKQIDNLPDGSIKSVVTDKQGEICADLFIDCTGFRSLLLGEHMKVPFIDKSDVLFVDHAIAIQVPYSNAQEPIACSTISTAQEAGWTWDIGLQTRRGIGYVYSSRHTSHKRAEQVLRDYVGRQAEGLSVNKFSMKVGYREEFWCKNCIGVGFSAGFLEPLESTALIMVEAAANLLCDQFPRRKDAMAMVQKRFNKSFQYRWERIIDFVKLHYYISKRDDSQFWIDNRDPETAPQSLLDKLEHWRHQAPMVYDFENIYETFTLDSYQWIIYGMNYQTDLSLSHSSYRQQKNAKKEFERVQIATKAALEQLPSHRELINKIFKYGLPKV